MAWTEGLVPLYMVQKPPFTVEVPGSTKVDGETIPRRHPLAKDGLLETPAPGVCTAFHLLKRSAQEFSNEPAVGSRKLLETHKEKKKVTKMVDGKPTEVEKTWEYFEMSGYQYHTYAEYEAMVLSVGSGLRKLGLNSSDKIHLFASTSCQWLCMAHAAASQSMPVVTAYDTLGPSGVEHSLLQTRPKAMYLDPHLLNVAKGPIQTADSVEYIIYNDATTHPIPEKDLDDWKAAHPNHTCISFSDLLQLGQDNSADPVPPKPQDIFCIMYTSGSTGSPKGVPVSHAQFVAAIAGLHSCIGEVVGQAECVLAYLPLAHIFELVLENLAMFVGATVGYGSPRTLSDASMRNCVGDMRELRPTLMVGVPQIWEAIKKGVIGKVSKASTITQTLFWTAFSVKSWLVAHNLPFQTIFDSLVFGQVRAMTGGRVRAIVNGASGIADGTRHFMSMVVAPMVTGYGLTETGANGALGNPLQYTPDAIGPITASIEVKLVAIPDLGYSTETTPPQGEILIRGGPTVVEYWQNPEETAKAIMPDGWFKTGDVGEFDANGHLKVIDRVKNLVKMQGGEYVALDKLESVYRGSPLAQNVMIFASSEQPRPVAVVSANGKLLAELAQKMGVEESRMCQDAAVRKAVLKDLLQAGKEGGLTALETIVGVVVVEEEWTPASGFVTATQKLDRRALNKKYMEDIKNCYGQK